MQPLRLLVIALATGVCLPTLAHDAGSCVATQAAAVAAAKEEFGRVRTPEARLRLSALTGDMDGLAIALQAMPSSAMSMLEAKRQALAGAAWVGSAAAVRFLLKAGAEPDAVTPMSTSPAMVFAAECGHLDAMRALKEQGADVFAGSKPESSDNILYGAFEAAIGGKQFLVASWLLDNGYNVCENGESERISRLVTHLDTTSGVPAELKDRLVCPTH